MDINAWISMDDNGLSIKLASDGSPSAAACNGGDALALFRKSKAHPPTCTGDAVLRSRRWLNAM